MTEPKLEHIDVEDVETNGIRLHVARAGDPNGPLVILLHGFPEFWYGWRHQIEPLAQAGYDVWAPDQRGYNLSDRPKGVRAYRMENLVADVLGLIDAAGREKATVIGHDWGAMVAWYLALLHPERLERLGILNVPHPAVMWMTILTNPEQMLRSSYVYFFQIPGLPEAVLRNNNWELALQMLKGSSRPDTFSPEDLEQYRAVWWHKGAMTAMINWYRAYARYRPSLPADTRIHVPTLMLWGVNDVALSRQMARPSIDLCDWGRLIYFDRATHWVQHDEAEQVNRYLIEFLGSDATPDRKQLLGGGAPVVG